MSTVRQNLIEVNTATIVTPQIQNGSGNTTVQKISNPQVALLTPLGITMQKTTNATNYLDVQSVDSNFQIGQISGTTDVELLSEQDENGGIQINVIRKAGSTTVFEIEIIGLNGRPGITMQDNGNATLGEFIILNEDEETSQIITTTGITNPIPLKSIQYSQTFQSSGALTVGTLAFRFETSSGGWGSFYLPFANTKILGYSLTVQRNNGTTSAVPAGGISIAILRNNVNLGNLLNDTLYADYPAQAVLNGRINLMKSDFPLPSDVFAKDDFMAFLAVAGAGSAGVSLYYALDVWMLANYD